ncbi:putative phosphotransferase enzyme family protein [Rosellinia necatrix]|uniref:Putative phosphotransferase enzyme family protein n=1 Tax=Rosellinia necatrix TaxID=77044 RepID=A0A1W2TRZ9_ROSNE|nr:putative phosphotransferase enzyme family protein [Rosellinia necatrix]
MGHGISVKTVKAFLKAVPFSRIVQKAQTATVGSRLFPSRTPKNDANHNFRIDRGAEVNGKVEMILQANKNASNPKVKEAAQKNSHAILAKGYADPTNDPDGDAAEEALAADFEARK